MNTSNAAQQPLVLLFYREYEADKFIPGDRYLKRLLRPAYNLLHARQKKTGFAVSFELLCRALKASGCRVRVNDYRFAKANPDYPVGVVGCLQILKDWELRNPALLGPSLYDHPGLAPKLLDDPRFRKYLVLADWTYDVFFPYYGERCVKWFAGIDVAEWPDLSKREKQFDFLIYDKIRWDHDELQSSLIEPICRTLDARQLTYKVLRYKFHDHETYRQMLAEARGMIFLCEHETQGLAYQEALASGVPILAWDNGYWLDPLWQRFGDRPPAASSVPFFSPECGERFARTEDFTPALDRFLARLQSLDPRGFVRRRLSLEDSAKIYREAYFSMLQS